MAHKGFGEKWEKNEAKFEHFVNTSHEPYDRHSYKLYMKDGTTLTFPDYEDVRNYWYRVSKHYSFHLMDRVEVVDKIDNPAVQQKKVPK